MKTNKSLSRIMALILSLALLMPGLSPAAANDCIHVHDELCGYTEGEPCAHIHDASCGGLSPVEGYGPTEGETPPEIAAMVIVPMASAMTGAGTQANPLQIGTAEQLAYIAELVNAGELETVVAGDSNAKVYLKLTNDIDLSAYGASWNGGRGWIPIGHGAGSTGYFKGVFNGAGKVITGLYIDYAGYGNIGLFGWINGGMVENLGVVNVCIKGGDYTGGVAGWVSNGSVTNCYVTGTVSGKMRTGGMVGGVSDGSVTNSYTTGAVSGTIQVGGVVGSVSGNNNNEVTNCYATGVVDGDVHVGGVAGDVFNGNVTNCAALGPSVKGSEGVGRVVGNKSGWLANNYAFSGLVDGNGSTAAWTRKNHDGIGGADMSVADAMDTGYWQDSGKWGNPTGWDDTNVWTLAAGRLPILRGVGGNQSGETGTYFTSKDITNATVTVNGTYTYTGSPIIPNLTVTCDGVTLAMDSDYTVLAINNIDVGTATATVTGKGNYTGETTQTFTIQRAPISGAIAITEQINVDTPGKIDEGDMLGVDIAALLPSGATLDYQWYLDGVPVAITASYLVPAGSMGKTITVQVTGTGNCSGSVTSGLAVVGKIALTGSISINAGGTAQGDTLMLNVSQVTPQGGDYTIQWLRDGAPISGENAPTYTIRQIDLGKAICAKIIGTGEYAGEIVAKSLSIPAVVPDAPPNFKATAGSGQVSLSWGAAFDGGSAVTKYQVSKDSGANWTDVGLGTSYTCTGLTNGTTYTFRVRAVNAVGTGGAATASATPQSSGGNTGSPGGGSGGGGGGGGVDGISTTLPSIPAANNTVQVSYIQDGGHVALSLPDSKINDIIGKSEDMAVLDLAGVEEATTAILPKTALSAFANAGLDVVIKLPDGTLTFSGKAAVSVAERVPGNSVSVEIRQLSISALNAEQRNAVSGSDVVIDINILAGAQKISGFEGALTVTVPYNGQLPVAGWYLSDDGDLEKLSCTYNSATKTVSFTTNHLSVYVLGQDRPQGAQDSSSATGWLNPFSDVQTSDWFYGSVEYAVTNGLFSGTSATTFSPHDTMTRGMMVTVLWRLAGSSPGSADFSDVSADAYYAAAVGWAAANGVVNGVGDNRFAPEDNITREQMTVMLHNYANVMNIALPQTRSGDFADSGDISGWAFEAVNAMYAAEVLNGRGANDFNPQGNASRAEVSTMYMNFIMHKTN